MTAAVRRGGGRDRPLPVVVVPGMLCDPGLWADVDFPGDREIRHVALEKPDIGALADDVLASVPGPFVLVGLSLGAIVGFEALRRAPERIAGLCVMSANARAPRPEQYAAWRTLSESIDAGRFADVVEQTLPDMFPGRRFTPRPAQRYRDMAHRVGPDAARAQLAAQATRTDAADALRSARCPALVLSGTRDALCPPAFHRTIAGTVPGARLRELPDAGHLLPWQRPDAVTGAVRAVVEAAERGAPSAAVP
ncbi:alpha/beta fold hydrolase [Streptomyces sp. NPDC016845]|uniref:alpha/beta fold hydrolase n=1 Tax=Streptomyces sp. NPDC016845 TaxID=3364972 RepID=UPI0037B65321